MTDQKPASLTPEQGQRVEALKQARTVLGAARKDVLVELAEWILGREEPTDRDLEEMVRRNAYASPIGKPMAEAAADAKAGVEADPVFTAPGLDEPWQQDPDVQAAIEAHDRTAAEAAAQRVPEMVWVQVTPEERDEAQEWLKDAEENGVDPDPIVDWIAKAATGEDGVLLRVQVPANLWAIRGRILFSAAGNGEVRRICRVCGLGSPAYADSTKASLWAWGHARDDFEKAPDRPVSGDLTSGELWRVKA